MSGFIAKQPNGLYCRFSHITDCPTHINMTKEDYLNNITGNLRNRQEGVEILEHYLQPFSKVTELFVPVNMTRKQFEKMVQRMSQ